MKCTLGIDPGLSGALCMYDPEQHVIKEIFDMPTLKITVNGAKKRQLDEAELARWIDANKADIHHATIEKPNAMPGQGVTSCFNFGFNCGVIRGIIAANFIRYDLVHPATWKKAMGVTKDKDACRQRASQLMPASCGLWARVMDDGRAESFLLASYGSSAGVQATNSTSS